MLIDLTLSLLNMELKTFAFVKDKLIVKHRNVMLSIFQIRITWSVKIFDPVNNQVKWKGKSGSYQPTFLYSVYMYSVDQSHKYSRGAIYFILTEMFAQNRSHEKLIRKFLHPITIAKRLSHTWEKRFIQSQIICQNESVSSQRVHVVVDAPSVFIHRSL